MPKTRKSARKTSRTRGAGPQFQIGCVLLVDDASREDLATKLQELDAQSLSNGLWSLKTNNRASKDANGTWSLTAIGRDWITGGANLENQRATTVEPSPARVKHSRRVPAVRAQEPGATDQRSQSVVPIRTEIVSKPSFRCAVISDGGFFLEKNGTRIDLEPDEHRHMLRYLERMSDEQPDLKAAA